MKTANMVSLVAASALAALSVGCSPAVSLQAGRTEVVVAPAAEPSVRFAAVEATNFLSQAFGVDVPLVDRPTEGLGHLFLGTNRWSEAAGVDVAGVANDGYAVLARGGDVFIAGRDDPRPGTDPAARIPRASWGSYDFDHGTLNGVYGFLEENAGVRFYFSGEMGTCVERRRSVDVPEGLALHKPDLQIRTWSQFSDGAWFDGEKPVQTCHPMKALNIYRQRYSTKNYGCCHGLNGFMYLERFGKTHPEYFAIDENGKRMLEADNWRRGHLCLTSGIREEIFKDCLSYCKGEPASVRGIPSQYNKGKFGWNYNTTPNYIDLMPQDGGAICHCERCKAVMRKPGRKARMTEVVWGLLAEVAGRLKKEGYEPTFTLMSYADYDDLPDCPLPGNLRVMIARTGPWANASGTNIAEDDAYYAKWEERLGGNKPWLWTYPNRNGCNSLDVAGTPAWAPRAWGRYYQGVSKHICGFFAESETDRCIDNLMGYYMLSHIGWNKAFDVDAAFREFHVRMFGPAAKEMQEVLERVEDRFTKDVAGSFVMTDVGPQASVPGEYERWTRIYSAEEMAKWAALFDAAAAKVSSDSVEGRRIAMFRRWMYDPPARRGAEYRASIDLAAGKARYKAGAARNLLGDSWWVSSPKGEPGALRDKEVTCVTGESKQLHCETEGRSVWALSNSMKKGLSLKPGATYRLSWFVKVDLVKNRRGGGAAMGVTLSGSDEKRPKWSKGWWFPKAGGYHEGKVDWISQSVEFTVPADAPANVRASAGPFMRFVTGKAWFDGLLLEEVAEAKK